MHGHAASPLITHTFHGRLEPVEHSLFETFLLPLPTRVPDALTPTFPSCQVGAPRGRNPRGRGYIVGSSMPTSEGLHYYAFSDCRGKECAKTDTFIKPSLLGT